MINWGTVPAGAVLPFHFASYDGATGASEAISGLAVTDVEVYKGISVTQRSSDAGYALIDSDGIDIDSIVGANGFSIDTGDNTDAGFFVAGSFYTVWVASVTADGQTVNFIAGTFRLGPAESSAGVPKVDTSHISGTAQTARDIGASVLLSSGTGTGQLDFTSGVAKANVTQFGGSNITSASGRPEVNTTHLAGSAVDQSGGLINANVKQISTDSTAADNAELFFDGTGYAGTNNVIPLVTTTTTLTNAPSDSSGVTTLLSRLSALRAGYLDNLSAGAVALASATTTIIASLGAWTGTGVNTILGAFKALLSKTASNPSDIGGTFDAATDSTEAIRDRGDAAWTTATGFSTLTQTQVTGGAYALNSASFAFNAALDLTTAQKASVNTEADTALADYDAPTKAELDSGLDALPTAAENAAALLASAVEGAVTVLQSLRLHNSAMGGKASGLATTNPKYRNLADAKDVIDATVDSSGNRTAVTLDLT